MPNLNNKNNLKVCLMGGRQAAVVAALAILSKSNTMVSAVSYSDDLTDILRSFDISVYKSIKDEDFVRDLGKSDILLSVHGREIVGAELLKLPKSGCINIHPYLYKYKGAKPVERALEDGNFKASVGAHVMQDKPDEGKVLIEEFVDVSGAKSPEEVYNRLYPYYAYITLKVLKIIGDKYEEIKE